VLDDAGLERATVVGNSMGGALALDLAATAPERVTGLVLLAPGVTGMTDEGEEVQWEAGAEAEAILGALDQAQQAGDVDAAVRLQLHLWLDGPTQPEGRVVGPARELAAEMSRRILEATGGRDEGDAEPDTWHHLGSVDVPAIVAWGDLDIPGDFFWYEQIGRRLARATTRVLHGCAHLPSLEQPEVVAALVREAVGGRG
jgi:pimeloyl-ACP methyl ester carboxylesterase